MTPDQRGQLVERVAAVATEAVQPHIRHVNECGSLRALQHFVATIDDFSIFDHSKQAVPPGGAVEFDRDALSRWLGARAAEVGAEQAVSECVTYTTSDTYQAYFIALLCGVQVIAHYDVDEHSYFASSYSIPLPWIRKQVVDSHGVRLPVIAPTGIFVKALNLPKKHVLSDAPEFFDASEYETFVDRLRLCLSLTGPVQAQIMATTTTPADGVPCGGGVGWTIHSFRHRTWQPPISRQQVDAAKTYCDKLEQLTKKDQDRLLISLKKINDFEASNDDVQRAIDLRVALESLFLDKSQGELTYRLSLRAAYFLGETYEERNEIAGLVKTAYDLGSSAVHNGRLPRKKAGQAALKEAEEASSDLRQTANLVRRAIIKSLDHPHAKFEDLILMGAPTATRIYFLPTST